MTFLSTDGSRKLNPVFWTLCAVFLLCAFGWAPHLGQIGRYNSFLAPDSMFILGVTLVAALTSRFWIPRPLVDGARHAFDFVKRHSLFLLPAFLLALLAGLYGINRFVLHGFMNSADEHSCYFLAECLRMGKWWTQPHDLPEFFNVVHVGNRDGKWFSVYPPGWPLLFAGGLETGLRDWLNPILSAASLFFFFQAGKRIFGTAAAFTAIVLTGLAPFFLFTSASYFSHSTCLFTAGLFLFSYVRWMDSTRERDAVGWASLCAFAAGYGLLTRYLTMAALMLPFAVYRIHHLIRKKEKWGRPHTAFAVIFLFLFSLVFVHNAAVTGKFLKAPNKYDKSWERLGFRGDYSVEEGLVFIAARFFYLMDWAPPAWSVLFLASFFLIKKKFAPIQQMCRWAFFCLAGAYFLYYSWGGNQYGPRYYYEGFPFLMLTLGDAFHSWWAKGEGAKRKLLAVLLVSLAANFYQFGKHARFFETATGQRKALYDLAERTLEGPSIVFIRGFLGQKLVMSEDDAVRNSPRLDGRILYAHDLGGKNSLLQSFYPERESYRGFYDRPAKTAKLEKLSGFSPAPAQSAQSAGLDSA